MRQKFSCIGSRSKPSRGSGSAGRVGLEHNQRLRRCYAKRHRLPGGGRGRRRNLRCVSAGARSLTPARRECRVLQSAAKVQDIDHRMPRLVPISGDQRRRADRDDSRDPGQERDRILPARCRRPFYRTLSRRATECFCAAGIRCYRRSKELPSCFAIPRYCANIASERA